MRTKSNILVWFLSVAAVLGIGLGANSCTPEGLTDNSEFSLYYPGISDIGPSLSINVSPTWHGATPSNFQIYEVTLDDQAFTEGIESFMIEAETGMVTLTNTEGLPTGTYKLSISCDSKGKSFSFPDAITVNMLKGVPEGITVEPASLEVKLEDIISGAELPSAQIKTDGEHISIKKYLFANVTRDDLAVNNVEELFKLSNDGKFTIIGKNKNFIPGVYKIHFKLTTLISGKNPEDGVTKDPLVLDVTSAPLALAYTPSEGLVEAGFAFKSPKPVLTGSSADLKYELVNSPKPELSIDATTGVLSFKEGNKLTIGDEFNVSVKATNKYGSKTFTDAYKMEVVKFIHAIDNFSYGNIDEVIQTCSFENKVKVCDGDNVTYSFKNLPDALKGLSINAEDGTVTASKQNSFPLGKHTVTVVAKNAKGSKEATFTVNIVKNPYMFTNVHWGNNLGLTPADKYASQYRLKKDESIKIKVAANDIPAGQPVKFILDKVNMKNEISIDEKTGEISVTYTKDRNVNYTFVKVAVGKSWKEQNEKGEEIDVWEEAAVFKKFPVFIDNVFNAPSGNRVEYTPFAICINPLKGGSGPAVKAYGKDGSELDLKKVSIDFRRTFLYCNLNGPASHGKGTPKEPGLLNDAWQKYYEIIKKPFNGGSRGPVSYNENKSNLGNALCYFKLEDGSLVVNASKFVDKDGVPANGVFSGQAPFITTGKTDPAGSNDKIFPIAIWFDTQFE